MTISLFEDVNEANKRAVILKYAVAYVIVNLVPRMVHKSSQLECLIEEYLSRARKTAWLYPNTPARVREMAPIIIFLVVLDRVSKIDKGLIFWRVDRVRQPAHLREAITNGIHWINGKSPSFKVILKVIKEWLDWMIENRNSADPAAWMRKYFITPSPVMGFDEKRGKKPNRESSSPTQVINQLLLLTTTIMERVMIDR